MLVILLISAFFSANLYRISIQEIDRGFKRQAAIINSVPRLRSLSNDPEFLQIRFESYRDAREALLRHLLITNLLILSLGGILSYVFAYKTLEPIEEAHDAQSRFTSDASHELRTPISVMRSEIEVAQRSKNLTIEQAREVFKSSLEEIDKLSQLINRLLLLARSQEKLTLQPCRLDQIAYDAREIERPLADAKGITINCGTTDAIVMAHPDYFIQAVAIVLDNAIKYSPNGSKITLKFSMNGTTASIDVKDQGPGISSKDFEKIFERFYRSDNSRTKQKVEGQGLGLSIARNIMNRQNGAIVVHSSNKKGSIFRLSVQLAQGDSSTIEG